MARVLFYGTATAVVAAAGAVAYRAHSRYEPQSIVYEAHMVAAFSRSLPRLSARVHQHACVVNIRRFYHSLQENNFLLVFHSLPASYELVQIPFLVTGVNAASGPRAMPKWQRHALQHAMKTISVGRNTVSPAMCGIPEF